MTAFQSEETNAGRVVGFSNNGWVIFPAVLTMAQTAQFLGFTENDIRHFISVGLLKPLGKPTQQAPKLFATVEIERLVKDQAWLNKAVQARYEYWRGKNSRKAANLSIEKSQPDELAVAA
jgi:hypothetical protein